MTRRIDVLRSWLRSAAQGTGRGLKAALPMEGVRGFLADLRRRRLLISMGRLSSALAHTPGAVSVSLATHGRKLLVDAAFEDGGALQVALVPVAIRFAPRGAKEVVLRAEPAERADDRRVADLVSALVGMVALDLYRPALPQAEPGHPAGAIVEREGTDRLRVDLRTVPAVRRARGSSALEVLIEVLEIRAIFIGEMGLRVEIKLPELRM